MSYGRFHLNLITRKIELKHKSRAHHIVIIKCMCTCKRDEKDDEHIINAE